MMDQSLWLRPWKRLLPVLLSFYLFCAGAAGLAVAPLERHNEGATYMMGSDLGVGMGLAATTLSSRQDASKPALRIMGLGASIMYGFRSTNGNGCRQGVRDALRFQGFEVDMVGTMHNGSMVDNDVEAVPGYILTQINGLMQSGIGYRPNVVMINAGTNDADETIDIANAGSRFNTILDTIWKSANYPNPDACVIVSALLPVLQSRQANGYANSPSMNSQYQALVTQLAGQGKCIYFADTRVIDPSTGQTWINPSYDINQDDGIHPTDTGYQKMASIMYDAIMQAYTDGKITPPQNITDTINADGCPKVWADSTKVGALTQHGSGYQDGIYLHNSVAEGVVLTLTSDWNRDQWFTAKLFSSERDDILGWYNISDSEVGFGVWKNTGAVGTAEFTRIADMMPDLYCIPEGITFTDMNNDGLDDIVCVNAVGNAYLAINNGDGSGSTSPTFTRVSDTALIFTGFEGYGQDSVRIADIDGDGRGDYCVIHTNGDIYVWRNGWVDNLPSYWQELGLHWSSGDMGDYTGFRFVDLNGGNGDDLLWMSDAGVVYTWTNSRSCAQGESGDGLHVSWRQGFHEGETSGPTHYGLEGDYEAVNKTSLRSSIEFAKIYGDPADFGERPRSDYVFFNHTAMSDGTHQFNVTVFRNTGAGGAKLKIDGNKYCNMQGHPGGSVDYVWTWSYGDMILFPSTGKVNITGTEEWWGPEDATFFTPPDGDLDRRDLHLADWDGDGDCDIIWTDPANENRITVWINNYKDGISGYDWTQLPDAPQNAFCSQTRGKAVDDLAVRFADINGDGKADFLCIEKDGRVTGFVQSTTVNNTYDDVGQIKFAETYDRANLRWADVNGDGLDDMLWVDKFTGDASVWYNGGAVAETSANGGSSYFWDASGPAYEGSYAGTCQFFPDLDGNGRADLHSITGTWTNEAVSWLNPSCGLPDAQGDDPGGVINPDLPQAPGGSVSGGGGGGSGVVYIGQAVWQDPHSAACEPPCVLVVPPSQLPATSTFSIPPYTTSVEVRSTVTTIVLHPGPIVTDVVPMSNVAIGPEATSTIVQPLPSIVLPDTEWVLTFTTEGSTTSTTRTIELPPWPQITKGPPEGWGSFSTASNPPTSTSLVVASPTSWPAWIVPSDTAVSSAPATTSSPAVVVFTYWPGKIYPVTSTVTAVNTITADDTTDGGTGIEVPCNLWFFNFCLNRDDLPIGGWRWELPPGPAIIEPGPPPPIAFDFGGLGGFEIEDPIPPWPPITLGDDQLPTFPSESDEPCETREASICPRATVVTGGTTTSTTYWMDITTCITFSGCWATDYEPTTSVCTVTPGALDAAKPNVLAKATATASTAITTTTASSAGRHGSTLRTLVATSAVSTASAAEPSSALSSQGTDLHGLAIAGSASDSAGHSSAAATSVAADDSQSLDKLAARQATPADSCDDVSNYICYPYDNTDQSALAQIRAKLAATGLDWNEIQSEKLQFTAFFHVSNMTESVANGFNAMYGVVSRCYPYQSIATDGQAPDDYYDSLGKPREFVADHGTQNDTLFGGKPINEGSLLQKRETGNSKDSFSWAPSQVSAFMPWAVDADSHVGVAPDGKPLFRYWRDSTAGEGQYIYMVDSGYNLPDHTAFSTLAHPPMQLTGQLYGTAPLSTAIHGCQCASAAAGTGFGVAPNAQLIFTRTVASAGVALSPEETLIEALLLAVNDIASSPAKLGTSVINMSWSVRSPNAEYLEVMQRLLTLALSYQAVLVTSAGNAGRSIPTYIKLPQSLLIRSGLNSMLVVGATDIADQPAYFSQHWRQRDGTTAPVLVYAPGASVLVPVAGPTGEETAFEDGTSISAAFVSGLVAYLRGLDSPWRQQLSQSPQAVRNLVVGLARELGPSTLPTIWNGQMALASCLVGVVPGVSGPPGCPMIPADLLSTVCTAQMKRDLTGLCWPVFPTPPPGSGSGGTGGGGGGQGQDLGGLQPAQFTWAPGPPAPTCAAAPAREDGPLEKRQNGVCGTVCEGYYCVPFPNGHGPSYSDPGDSQSPPPPPATSSKTTQAPPPQTSSSPPPPPPTSSSTPSDLPCAEIHCYQYTDPGETDGDDSFINVEVYENNVKVCIVAGPPGLTAQGSTVSSEAAGGCLASYEVSVTGNCDSYSFTNTGEPNLQSAHTFLDDAMHALRGRKGR